MLCQFVILFCDFIVTLCQFVVSLCELIIILCGFFHLCVLSLHRYFFGSLITFRHYIITLCDSFIV